MAQSKIIAHGEGAAVILPADLLESIGLRIGDMVEVNQEDRQLIFRPVEDTNRRRWVEEITREVIERRQEAYRRLA
jgi:antitoxin component of MazEF toxin-antitoxin module